MSTQNEGSYEGMICRGSVMVAEFGQPCGHGKEKVGVLRHMAVYSMEFVVRCGMMQTASDLTLLSLYGMAENRCGNQISSASYTCKVLE